MYVLKVGRINEAIESYGKGAFGCTATTSSATTTSTSTSASTSTSTSPIPVKGLATCHGAAPQGSLFSFDSMPQCESQVAHIMALLSTCTAVLDAWWGPGGAMLFVDNTNIAPLTCVKAQVPSTPSADVYILYSLACNAYADLLSFAAFPGSTPQQAGDGGGTFACSFDGVVTHAGSTLEGATPQSDCARTAST